MIDIFVSMSSKKSWPDLVGKPIDEAVAVIQKENPGQKHDYLYHVKYSIFLFLL